MKKTTREKALALLMFQNKFDYHMADFEKDPDFKPEIVFPVCYVLAGKLYLFDYIVNSVPRNDDDIIELVFVEEALEEFRSAPIHWREMFRRYGW